MMDKNRRKALAAKIKSLRDEYLASVPDDNRDENYSTTKEDAEWIIDDFLQWLEHPRAHANQWNKK